MKKLIIFVAILALAFVLPSCSEDKMNADNDLFLGLGGDDFVPNEIDEWIYTSYTVPYNMEVKYRWDRSELTLNSTLVPIKEEIVVPVMDVIKRTWIDPYEEVVGGPFIKKLSPKKFILVGSPKYSNGTLVLGEAEGGRKIVIYRLNWFNRKDKSLLQSVLKTVHHEFAHTMHQHTKYPIDFEEVTPGGYNAAWTSVPEKTALKLGFVTQYACASPNEDFSDMIAMIVVFGREWFDERVALAAKYYADPIESKDMYYDPAAALRNKETIIINYLQSVWNVSLYDQMEPDESGQIPQSAKGLVTLVAEAFQAIVDEETAKN